MQRLKAYAPSILKPMGVTRGIQQLKRKASNSWSAVQDTYFSTKDVFERHRVVFTIGTSVASLATAWAGYSLRYAHQSKVEQRLQSIEQAMTKVHDVEREEIKKIVNSGNVSYTACFATAGTTLIIGYGLGWRGGKWHANRVFRKQQQKLLGLNKPQQWRFLRKSFLRSKVSEANVVNSRATHVDTSSSQQAQLS